MSFYWYNRILYEGLCSLLSTGATVLFVCKCTLVYKIDITQTISGKN